MRRAFQGGRPDDHPSFSAGTSLTAAALAIEASGLRKAFGKTQAVDGVDLAVRTGSVYGILGPNGAGKTTTVRMLATLLRPDEGEARVLGYDIVDEAGRLTKHYSGGMRRRLDIAASIVGTPGLMFLAEPTTGLDPRSRNQVWDILRTLVADGTTVLLCTQYLDEADQLADGIAVIDHGKAIAEGTPAQLKASVGSGALHVRLLDPEQRPAAERALSSALVRNAPPSRWPSSPGSGSEWPGTPSANRASTRSSWRSPATRRRRSRR